MTVDSYCVARCANIKCDRNRVKHPHGSRGFATADYSNRCNDHIVVKG